MRITISPDENPGDPGTTADPAITERDLNLQVAHALQAALLRCGQDAKFNPDITFVERVAQANADGTDLLFACAHNAGGGQGMVAVFCPGGHQTETPTWAGGRPNRQDELAAAIADELQKAGLTQGWTHLDEQIYECCSFNRDTAYIEFLFMDSEHDREIYHQAGYAAAAAEAACRAVARVYGFAYVPAAAPAPAPAPQPAPSPAPQPSPVPAPAAFTEEDLARGMVVALYASVLDRLPEAGAVDGHLADAQQHGLEVMVTDIVTSAEATQRLADRAKLRRLADLLPASA